MSQKGHTFVSIVLLWWYYEPIMKDQGDRFIHIIWDYIDDAVSFYHHWSKYRILIQSRASLLRLNTRRWDRLSGILGSSATTFKTKSLMNFIHHTDSMEISFSNHYGILQPRVCHFLSHKIGWAVEIDVYVALCYCSKCFCALVRIWMTRLCF